MESLVTPVDLLDSSVTLGKVGVDIIPWNGNRPMAPWQGDRALTSSRNLGFGVTESGLPDLASPTCPGSAVLS